MNKYLGPIRALGGAAVIAFIIGFVFPSIAQVIPDERVRNGVLTQSIPFVSFFVGILLLFILLIVLTARRFDNRIPHRTYHAIELVIIVGILGGVFTLFQGYFFAPYKYGFILMLSSTLLFILWSHVVPRSAKADIGLLPISTPAHIIGAIAGILVVVFLVSTAISVNRPQAPYGIRERLWNSYDDARKAEIIAEIEGSFNNVEVPTLIIINLLPGLLFYFVAREVADGIIGNSAQSAKRQPLPAASRA